MRTLSFADPWLLWVLVPLFVLWLAARWGLPRLARRAPAAIRFSSLERLRRIPPSRSLLLRRAVQALRVLAVALLILGMARPQTGRERTRVRSEGIDIVLVLDTSGSMQALDLDAERAVTRRRNRLEVARGVVEAFVEGRPSDQIGLVVFGEEAYTQCPLTLDHGILASLLERVEIGMAGDATAIGSALGIAVKRLEESEAKSKVIILLTDGRNNAGTLTPGKAAEVAARLGVKVYAVGAGSRGKAPFLVDSPFGRQVVYEDVEIDEETLRQIAERTGGAYFRAEDREALAEIYRRIDQLEKSEITTDTYTEYRERFRALVAPAAVLLLLELALVAGRFRRLP